MKNHKLMYFTIGKEYQQVLVKEEPCSADITNEQIEDKFWQLTARVADEGIAPVCVFLVEETDKYNEDGYRILNVLKRFSPIGYGNDIITICEGVTDKQ